MKSIVLRAAFCASLLQFGGCTVSQDQRVDGICRECAKHTLTPHSDIPLSAYIRMPEHRSNGLLHVYIEGDGVPWRGFEPSKNPTSRTLTALSLMRQDPHASAYINRPCYGWTAMPPTCGPSLWTDHRYSAEIVGRMNRALDELAALTETTQLLLFGHSGGGTLAMLMAQDRDDVLGIVSVAANLDHHLWTWMRGFNRLEGSLNPVELPPLAPNIVRMHLAGGHDRQVPAKVVEMASRRDPYAVFRIYDGFDHHCCWTNIWTEVIREAHLRIANTGVPFNAQRSAVGTK